MTISKPNLHLIKNSKEKLNNETMALLKKLLDKKGINQATLAKELHKDKTTINR
jgi:predicted transcriptional regulator